MKRKRKQKRLDSILADKGDPFTTKFIEFKRTKKKENLNTSNELEEFKMLNIVNFTNLDKLEEVNVDNPDFHIPYFGDL